MTPDKTLQASVVAELTGDPSINSAHIGVGVNEGVVTLSGVVDSFSEKWEAERAAKRVQGVRALAVELKVQLQSTAERSDSDLARAAISALQWTRQLPAKALHVLVEDGNMTLSGVVHWDFQREAALATVRHLQGLRNLTDEIAVKPQINCSAVAADIERALQRRAHGDARRISVAVQGATVTLSGEVDSWAEHGLALQAAWNTPGVRHVHDELSFD
ncbi:MAG: BON domain-containing protein [Curvibacter lanceolatus]|uniref:BON domain-containing protein n=1 Tax=Curvibacter lanceolatus TaxID=86182 RepID=UPI0003636188|nr:BON domain-containing protein [Curvibacter lanceolatus]MBV5291791.1 BON domain-containing protein [Curvibacter lanceolatus]